MLCLPYHLTDLSRNGLDDPDNPQNYSRGRKALVSFLIVLMTFAAYTGSALYTPSIPGVEHDLGVSSTIAILGLSLFILGYSVGPILASCAPKLASRANRGAVRTAVRDPFDWPQSDLRVDPGPVHRVSDPFAVHHRHQDITGHAVLHWIVCDASCSVFSSHPFTVLGHQHLHWAERQCRISTTSLTSATPSRCVRSILRLQSVSSSPGDTGAICGPYALVFSCNLSHRRTVYWVPLSAASQHKPSTGAGPSTSSPGSPSSPLSSSSSSSPKPAPTRSSLSERPGCASSPATAGS
jgi:hypothetical protein